MRRSHLCLAILTFVFSSAATAAERAEPKQVGKAAKPPFQVPDSVKLFPDLCYARYGDRKVLLDLYLPKNPTKPKLPCIVVIHGGGWRSNSKQTFAPIASYMAEHGLAAVSIDYRLLPEAAFPACIEDCKAAVRWVRANAKQYGIDGEKIGTIGGSAGGHLAAMLGTSHKVARLEGNGGNPGVSSRVQAVVVMAGPADMSGFARATGSIDKDMVALISPVTHIDADAAPTLILQGENDKLVPMRQAELLEEKLKQAGVPVELVKVPNAGHGFWNSLPRFNSEMDRAVGFFERTLNGRPSDASSPPAAETVPPLADTSVLLYLYDLRRSDVFQSAVDALAPLVRLADIFVLVSGNHRGTPDIELITRCAENLHRRFPHNGVWVLTSGLANVKALAAARKTIPACMSGIVYDYEPNWDNEPEFAADFAKTIDNFTQVVKAAHDGSFVLAGTPSGRYLLQAPFASLGWDYGRLAQASGADGMQVQTQGYCKKGLDDFQAALAKLKAQQTAAGVPLDRMYPQVTVGAGGGNAVPPPQAVACVREAHRYGFTRIALWFAPTRVGAAVEFLKGLGRQAAAP